MIALDPRAELVAEYRAAKDSGNQKRAMSILMQIGKLDALKPDTAPDPEPAAAPESFTTQQAVVKYLVDQGWKSNDSTLSLHIQQRKLIPAPDGTFTLESVMAYAADNLVNNPLRSEKNEADDVNQKIKAEELRRQKYKNDLAEGLLVNSDDVKRELENMLVSFRSRILLIPRKLSAQISQMSDIHKVEELLNRELRDTLTTLSQYHIESPE